MSLFSIFRKPRMSAAYLDADEYISTTPREVLPSANALPDVSPVPPVNERSEALAEMLLDASRASEDAEGSSRPYASLEPTPSEVFALILEANLPVDNRTRIQLNALYARDHEAWMRTLESDLESLAHEPDSTDFQEALAFRNEHLEMRRRALSQSALGLEACGAAHSELAHSLHLKIEAIERALNPVA